MRSFMYVVFTVALLATFISDLHITPGVVKFFPDLMAGLVILYVFAAGVRQQFRYVNGKYWLTCGALALVILCGPIINQESVGPIIAGLRYYVRSIPLFFLPAVFSFSDRDVDRFLKLLLGLSLLQVPISLYQRISHFSIGETTGDVVTGTMISSGVTSLFLISAMSLMAAFMLRGRMSKLWFGVCFVLMVVAVSINETKVTFLVLPIVLLTTFIAAAPRGRRVPAFLQSLAFLTVFLVIFIPVYDALNKKDDGTPAAGILEFLTDQKAVSKYMNTDTAAVGSDKDAGRGDSIEAPFIALSSDPIKLAFGLGIGNVSRSSLGEQFSGRYERLYYQFAFQLSASTFLFETGVVGTCLIFLLLWMIFRDTLYIAKRDDGLMGTLALGYIGVWITVVIAQFYAPIHISESISYPFWFFSGLIASRRQRLAVARVRSKSTFPSSLVPVPPRPR